MAKSERVNLKRSTQVLSIIGEYAGQEKYVILF